MHKNEDFKGCADSMLNLLKDSGLFKPDVRDNHRLLLASSLAAQVSDNVRYLQVDIKDMTIDVEPSSVRCLMRKVIYHKEDEVPALGPWSDGTIEVYKEQENKEFIVELEGWVEKLLNDKVYDDED